MFQTHTMWGALCVAMVALPSTDSVLLPNCTRIDASLTGLLDDFDSLRAEFADASGVGMRLREFRETLLVAAAEVYAENKCPAP